MLRSHPLLARFVLLLALPGLVVTILAVRRLRASLPHDTGRLEVRGLAAPVQISRDEHGTPSIVAQTDRDAFFAVGYVHAQDRLWQLELQRRLVAGRLSEVFGRGSISQDVWARTLGLQRVAASAWSDLSPGARDSLTAYAEGVNAWLATHRSLPLEFDLLGVTPEPWSATDSLAWNCMFALSLGGNFREEMTRFLAAQVLSPEKLSAFYGAPADRVLLQAGARLEPARLSRLVAFQALPLPGLSDRTRAGSNAWVVAGSRAEHGQALLANDPHLPLQLPSLWYALRLEGDRLDTAGMSLVGLPVVIFGRSRQVAWGGTNMMADQQDLYLERVDPNDAGRYEVDGHFEPFVTRRETIAVKADFPAWLREPLQPITIEVRSTRHGPIISDQFDLFDQPVALHWSLFERPASGYEAFYRVGYAHDWPSFTAAFAELVAPALNMLYADDHGHVGYVGVGRIPVRTKGDGTLPVPGWDSDYTTRGAIPFAEMPRAFDPPQGYLVNANNRVTTPAYPHFISTDWARPDRAARIEELLRRRLASGARLSVADMGAIQADVVSLPAARLARALATFAPPDARLREVVALLAGWDGATSSDSVAAALFFAWRDQLRREIFDDDVQVPWNRQGAGRALESLRERPSDDELAALLANDPLGFCDRSTSAARETCQDAMGAALRRAVETLRRLRGARPSTWAWGRVHHTRYAHTPFSATSLLRRFFEREVGNGGAPDSVNVASASLDETAGYVQTFGPGFRQIISLGAQPRHLYMNSTGQSGNVLSAHYDDMVVPFRDVAFYSLEAAGRRAEVLTLAPLAAAPGVVP